MERQELGFLYFKPNDDIETDELVQHETRKLLKDMEITILYEKELVMTEEMLKMHHPDLFVITGKEDEGWKKVTIDRALCFNKNLAFLLSGVNCLAKTLEIKQYIRTKYVKREVWEATLSKPNCIHTSGTKDELLRDVKSLMPEKIPFLELVERIRKDQDKCQGKSM